MAGNGIRDPRALAAVWAGKTAGSVSRALGLGGGTTIPGDVARALDPGLLARLGRGLRLGSMVITGTNGKTTISHVGRTILEAEGLRVVANRSGANLVFGVTAAMLGASSWSGEVEGDWGVFEVDEGNVPAALTELAPRVTVVSNLFRDQLDRYGELESAAQRIAGALRRLPPESVVCLCADDPLVASLGRDTTARVVYFGMTAGEGRAGAAADARVCTVCGAPLNFSWTSYGHLGDWRCSECEQCRPPLDYSLSGVTLRGMEGLSATLHHPGGTVEMNARLPGTYNAYNLLAAAAATGSAGVSFEAVALGAAATPPAFGRAEAVDVDGVRVHLLLAKNPAGFDESLHLALGPGAGEHFLVAINDRIADGRDVSWLWDVDFEALLPARFVTVSGTRSADMALRLRYAGMGSDRVMLVDDDALEPVRLARALDAAVERCRTDGRTQLFALLTYTAMLGLRAVLDRRGLTRAYWAT
ncbi:MAG: DUF1727 domain-containing protein [Candidatus Dormibacteria bacterium]